LDKIDREISQIRQNAKKMHDYLNENKKRNPASH